jgi:hypothetical protein
MKFLLWNSFEVTKIRHSIVIISWREVLRSIVVDPEFQFYLTKYSQNKEIFDHKTLLIKDVLYLCEVEQEPVFVTFAASLRSRLTHKPQGEM